MQIWNCNDIKVFYNPELEGDGISMAPLFVDYLKKRFSQQLPFERAFEWCAGPGFIGFALLSAGICRHLVLSDISPQAMVAARQTAEVNKLHDSVTLYEGNNLDALDNTEQFDLVVGNPPNYYCINPQHPSYYALREDLRPNDPGWKLHRAFYRGIPRFLANGAVLCIEEVDPFATKCYTPNQGSGQPLWGPEPFDIRPRPPIEDFQDMIVSAGLTYVETVSLPHPTFPVHFVVSQWDKAAAARWNDAVGLRPGVQIYRRLSSGPNGKAEFTALQHGRALGSIQIDAREKRLPILLDILASSNGEPVRFDHLFSQARITPQEGKEVLRALYQLRWLIFPADTGQDQTSQS